MPVNSVTDVQSTASLINDQIDDKENLSIQNKKDGMKGKHAENFIITTFKFSEDMEEKTQAYVKGARDKGKDLEAAWQTKHKNKAQKQLELAQYSKYMAWTSTFLLATSIATTVGSAVLMAGGGANAQVGQLLGRLGDTASNQGNRLAETVSGVHTQPIHSEIEILNQNAQKIWEADKRAGESREEALKSMQEKSSSATQAATERLGQAFSLRG